ncbi:MAG: YebC/PmpR family DNA-binding transcriptional regulator [Fastidiosipilaceae bacterium]|jgi:YebC/PmpR family DNA-binding regulatory protein|nr:YebC/PmpR family DNA-binding transcriptional regulator [Clostridiaceae bacterium]
MAGHSKWSNIKRRKGAVDAKRAKIFTKIGREIQVAVRAGGPDPEINSRLKDVIAKARANNMPNDNINRSIKKASGDGSTDQLEDIQYEGYGAGGVAFMVRTLTDNRNRTAADIRHIFDKFGGNLGTTGCVSFMFQNQGQIFLEREKYPDAEEIMMAALEAGAEDIVEEEEVYVVVTAPENYHEVLDQLSVDYEIASSELGPVPDNTMNISDAETVTQLEKLIDALEDNDDVQDIYHNWDE